jgi:hypothetical protein
MVPSLLQASLFEDAVQGTRREVIAGFPGHRYASWLGIVFELAVASSRRNEPPTVVLQHLQYLADFHSASISGADLSPGAA